MKLGRLLATIGIAGLLVAGLTTFASAQNIGGKIQPPTKGNIGQKLGKQRNNLGNRQNDPDVKLMRKTANECQRAHKVMQSALPIYHGHRHNAMELTRIAVQEIRLGIRMNKLQGNAPQSFQAQLKGIQKVQEEDPTRYPKGQVIRSNKKMEAALKILTTAKADLAQVTKDFNGHKANAMTAIDMAIGEINLALGSIKG